MSESRIHLFPSEEAASRCSHTSTPRARRWRSAFEDDEQKPVVSVFVAPRAYVRFCAHAGTDLDHEVGGVLVGERCADEATGEPFIVVEAVLPARHTRQGSAYLTFTQDSLVALHDELEERYSGKEMVGWYHTHPRMGVFLSGYDTWLHHHFFPELWQVALVIEPHSVIGGFFIRQADGWLDPRRYAGFYELSESEAPSVVHWRNLELEAEAQVSEGE